MNNKIFITLDSLRGIAALGIALLHLSPKFGGMYLAVDFFLVLSGFIITYTYMGRNISIYNFIVNRIARLYPLHIITLLFIIIINYISISNYTLFTKENLFYLLQQIFLLQNIGLNQNGLNFNFPSWSISVEFWVNILLYIFIINKKIKIKYLLFFSMIGFLLIYIKTGNLDTHYLNYFSYINSGIIRGMSSFSIGIISYIIYIKISKITFKVMYINILEVLILIILAIIIFNRKEPHSDMDFFAPFVFLFVVLIYSLEQGFISKLLSKISYLGKISYSIYLIQFPLIMILNYINISNKYVYLFIYLFILFIFSHFSYKYIEVPFKIIIRQYFGKK